jgi:hypothetical protein
MRHLETSRRCSATLFHFTTLSRFVPRPIQLLDIIRIDYALHRATRLRASSRSVCPILALFMASRNHATELS